MIDNLYIKGFSEIFSRLLSRSNVSCYQISHYTGIDQAYLSRLRNGEKYTPSTEVILKICIALAHFGTEVKLSDIEEPLNSVGRTIV
jgi:DNA-binding Xre family transcriptional regulator